MISNKLISVVGALALGVVVLASTTQGCGGGSGSSASFTSTCESACDKEIQCEGANIPANELAAATAACKSNCTNTTSSSSAYNSSKCPGVSEAQAISKANACIAGTCDALVSCLSAICPSSNGGAGTTGAGTAGTTSGSGSGSTGAAGTHATGAAGTSGGGAGTTGAGAGGTAGGDCQTTCAKAAPCCTALATFSHADAGTTCDMYTSICTQTSASNALQACQAILQTGVALNLADCK
jgi:hypothetical protein